MNKIKFLLIFGFVFQLGACAQSYSLIKTERVGVNDTYSVHPKINWNQLKDGTGVVVWTAYGTMLDRVVFISNIKDGAAIFGDDKTNVYKNDMNEVEIAELFIESMINFGKWPDGKFNNLKKQKHGPFGGFNFDITFLNPDSLSYKGTASGAIIDKELYLVFFLAAEIYFHDNLRDEFLNIISSIQKL